MFVMVAEMKAGGERGHCPEIVGAGVVPVCKPFFSVPMGTKGPEIEKLHRRCDSRHAVEQYDILDRNAEKKPVGQHDGEYENYRLPTEVTLQELGVPWPEVRRVICAEVRIITASRRTVMGEMGIAHPPP